MPNYPHTPGPWICHSGAVWKDGPNVYPKGQEMGVPIARMDREPGNGTQPVERDSNARLIAAAPELLEALEIMVIASEYDLRQLGHCGPTKTAASNKARAAITKAKQ